MLVLTVTDGIDAENLDELSANLRVCDGAVWHTEHDGVPITITTTRAAPSQPEAVAVEVRIDDPFGSQWRHVLFVPGDADILLMVTTTEPSPDAAELHEFLVERFRQGGAL